jgi:hypothetical protein
MAAPLGVKAYRVLILRFYLSEDHVLSNAEDLKLLLDLGYYIGVAGLYVLAGLMGLFSESYFIIPLCMGVAIESIYTNYVLYKKYKSGELDKELHEPIKIEETETK